MAISFIHKTRKELCHRIIRNAELKLYPAAQLAEEHGYILAERFIFILVFVEQGNIELCVLLLPIAEYICQRPACFAEILE